MWNCAFHTISVCERVVKCKLRMSYGFVMDSGCGEFIDNTITTGAHSDLSNRMHTIKCQFKIEMKLWLSASQTDHFSTVLLSGSILYTHLDISHIGLSIENYPKLIICFPSYISFLSGQVFFMSRCHHIHHSLSLLVSIKEWKQYN